ncbi:DUF84 family protein [Lederbergia wuyishanensis]|uniref:inosine/xanthosine triphosphatase n=1 Tax=Lederbergia wuyishanensis TaxID=1347903 RepID=A0ABU0D4X7_9BACI|nr:DUF84 family protein [Lederbergia wuyishanensis]MCJ8009557.1 DUF84 family protein [Lederbergia wuyishanensis]MDQ0343462.1 inosine/xanthosine triphosphatase [Lederbergia wuyishanensis]
MKIAVGSKNAAKNKAAETVLRDIGYQNELFPINAPSNVSGMPFSDEETMRGAMNRAEYCLTLGEVDIAIGLEGGVTETPNGLFLINYGALAERSKETIVAGGARIKLPEEIAERLRAGEELGPVMEDYSKNKNVRSKEGAIGIFTHGMVNRDEMFMHIMKLLVGQRGDWHK